MIDAKEYAFLLGIMHRCPNAQLKKRLNLVQQRSINERVAARMVVMAPAPVAAPSEVAHGSPPMPRGTPEQNEESKLATD